MGAAQAKASGRVPDLGRRVPAPLDGFDFAVLDDPTFGEDAVREEIITPLLKALGYEVSGRFRIVRSKRLIHPFVQFGTTTHRLTLVPDYVLFADEAAGWILDAKSPSEAVDNPKHVQQAYSYAMHSEIRAPLYAICNGRDLAVYHVHDPPLKPRLRVTLTDLDSHWQQVLQLLGCFRVRQQPEIFEKDFEIHLLKMGVQPMQSLVFFGVPILQIGKRGPDEYIFTINTHMDMMTYAATYVFGGESLGVLTAIAGRPTGDNILTEFSKHKQAMFHFKTPLVAMDIVARLTTEIQETEREHYLPLRISEFTPSRI